MLPSYRRADNPRLSESPPSLPPTMPRPAKPTTCEAAAKLASVSRLWLSFCKAFDDLAGSEDDGVAIEDFAPVYAMYRQLRRAGVAFCESFILRMEELNRDALRSSDDPDDDACVCDSERDDPDEDSYDEIYVNEAYDDAFEGSDDAFDGDDSRMVEHELLSDPIPRHQLEVVSRLRAFNARQPLNRDEYRRVRCKVRDIDTQRRRAKWKARMQERRVA